MSGPRRAQPSPAASPAQDRRPAQGRWRVGSLRRAALPAGVGEPSVWGPLLVILVVAAAARLPTLSLQSFWYDEAYTPVHVLHASLAATLRSVAANENTPPLWYVLVWAISRVLGSGVVALRLLSALAGVALVGVGWAIGEELGSRRTAAMLAAILALNPLMVWYSQEARAYELYALLGAVSLLCFLRCYRAPRGTSLALWSLSSVLALLTHYFAVFLVGPEALALLIRVWAPRRAPGSRKRAMGLGVAASAPATRLSTGSPPRPALLRQTLLALAAVLACGAALAPLVSAQAGRGTQWIGSWALSGRLVQIPGYFLLGANGSVLGHGLLALAALPPLAAVVLSYLLLRRGVLTRAQIEAGALVAGLGIVAILIPLALALVGADYLAPRNLIADWVPLSAALALVLAAGGRAGLVLGVVICLSGAGVLVATDLDPRLERADWNAVARALAPGSQDRAIVTVELGASPLEYYLPHLRLHYLSRRLSASVREIDLVGYAPLRSGALRPPTPAFSLLAHSDIHGLLAYRYVAATPQRVSGRFLRTLTITAGEIDTSEALLPAAIPATRR
jgi:mannosyltransferase